MPCGRRTGGWSAEDRANYGSDEAFSPKASGSSGSGTCAAYCRCASAACRAPKPPWAAWALQILQPVHLLEQVYQTDDYVYLVITVDFE